MSALVAPLEVPSAPPSAAAGLPREALLRAIRAACGRVPPLWPLRTYVAVNPFLGFSGQSFATTAATLKRVAGTDILMPRAWYRAKIDAGIVTDDDLLSALARNARILAGGMTVADLKAAAAREPLRLVKPKAVVATVSEVLDRLAGGDRQASCTAFMIDEISKWCAGYFDGGEAAWTMPGRALAPYPAWRATVRHDRNPEVFGITGFRAAIAALPADPVEAIAAVIAALGIPDRAVEDYLVRALFDVLGWAAYVRHLGWRAAQDGVEDDRLVHLLAIRLVWGFALFRERRDEAFVSAWAAAMAEAAALPADSRLGQDPELGIDLTLHLAFEAAHQRRLVAAIAASASRRAAPGRPAAQAAFCIDVRSEVFRRALEAVASDVETIGFAGFFGFPVEYARLGRRRGGAQAPVLLKPSAIVCETVAGGDPGAEARAARRIALRDRIGGTWASFKESAVSSFTFVEAAGLGFAARIALDTLKRPFAPSPALEKTVPRVAPSNGTGLDLATRTAMAAGALRGMSLTAGFARLVLLVGHGSTTVNNPHASGLDCGACGGHTGEANARIAAIVLNDPAVRGALAAEGIVIPDDTVFLAGLHDTTTDVVRLFLEDAPPTVAGPDLDALVADLAAATGLARRERAAALGLPAGADAAIVARSRDWSEVRPEWGLAGNAAFIAAPRARTAGLDLKGQAFLHSYDWRRDDGFKVLELIMTAPMVVASWINLAYYGSAVNNRVFGAGNKTLHNVAGTVGVLEGNGGDLRIGLPWQSVHDGETLVHEPLRLSVVLEAPLTAIEGVIARNDGVRNLVDNGWIHLFALTDDGVVLRRTGPETWISEARAGA